MVGIRNNKDIQLLNSMLKDMCQQKQVVFVDLYTLLEDEDGNFDNQYTYDGLHPNAQGYVVITQALKKVLR